MSSRSKHKREMRKKEQELKVVIAYYRNNPVKFLEEHLNYRLNWYQKLMVKLAFKFKSINKWTEVEIVE